MNLEINNKDIEGSFKRIATDLMNNWILIAGNKSYRICELEFYCDSDSHRDPYIHRHDLQKKMGKWYFHGSGLDMTFGSEKYHRSILIRAIYDIEKSNYIYGPLNTVTELLGNLPGIYGGDFSLKIELDNTGKIKDEYKIEPIKAPRVGLTTEKDSNESYCQRNYRFFVMPKKNIMAKKVL
jgi:hypothetical protein